MDDDPVLVSLHEELERDDPRLAALLDGRSPGHRRAWVWGLLPLLLVLVLVPLLLLPPRIVFGLVAVLAIIASPLAVCWLIAPDDGPADPRP